MSTNCPSNLSPTQPNGVIKSKTGEGIGEDEKGGKGKGSRTSRESGVRFR